MQIIPVAPEIFTIEGFLSPAECDGFIRHSEQIGYELATVNTDRGQRVVKSVRNNNRVLYTDENLAVELWERLKLFAPQKIGNSEAIGLNELFRFYKYQPGQQFKKHIDQSYIRNNREASYYTFMIYLNEGYEGGETSFSGTFLHPAQGKAVIFLHSLEHEGREVVKGTKYVLRTDIMYRLADNIIDKT